MNVTTPPDGALAGKVVLISGADNPAGIGYAIAKRFVAVGARVGLLGLGGSGMADLAATLAATGTARAAGTAGALGVHCDVTDAVSVGQARAAIESAFGPVTTVVANAGVVSATALERITADELARVIRVNLGGTLNLVQAALPSFVEGGSIITLGSIAAQQGGGLRGGPHYAASKGGVLALTRSIARTLGPRGIRANVIHPGVIRSPMTSGSTPEQEAELADRIPLGRIGTPDDVASVAQFFASDLSRYVTGTDLAVNGGLFIG